MRYVSYVRYARKLTYLGKRVHKARTVSHVDNAGELRTDDFRLDCAARYVISVGMPRTVGGVPQGVHPQKANRIRY